MLKHPNVVPSHQPLTPFNWRPFDLYNNVDIQKTCVLGHLFSPHNSAALHKQRASGQSKCLCCCYCCGARHPIDRQPLSAQPSHTMDESAATGRTFVANYRKLESPAAGAADDMGHHVRSRSVTDSCSDSDKCHCCNSAIRNLVQLYFQSRDNKFASNNGGRFNQHDCVYTENLCAFKGQMAPTAARPLCTNNANDRNRSKYHRHYRSNSCENVSDIDVSDKLMAIMPKRTHKPAPLDNLTQLPNRKYRNNT